MRKTRAPIVCLALAILSPNLVVLSLPVIGLVAGCASQTPPQQLFTTRGTATIVLKDINLARQMGKINDAQQKEINLLVKEVDRQFDAWDAAVKSGDPVHIDYATITSAILAQIKQYLIAKGAPQ